MFVISKSDSYTWPVKINIPTDGGKFNPQTFDAKFKRLPQSRIDDITKPGEFDAVAVAREILLDWSGINDESGQAVPFSEAMRDQLLDIPRFAASILSAYIESLSGARRKN